jgi:SOS-response transcriptional repressor LexA
MESANEAMLHMDAVNPPLSDRQQAILRFIQEYVREHKHPPSMREIGRGVGMPSNSNVVYHINRMVDLGYLNRQPEGNRTLVVLAVDYQGMDESTARDWATQMAGLRAENRRLREWCRQLERELAWERKQYQAAQAG